MNGTSAHYQHGWYKLAFVRDLKDELTPATVGNHRFVIVRTTDHIRVVDADCPHRGAHLGYGGMVEGNCIICPFHRYRIGFGAEETGDFQVREYKSFVIGGSVYVRLSETYDNGFVERMHELKEDHTIHAGFTMEIKCPPEIIIENGFDNAHFRPVHGINAGRFVPEREQNGSLRVDSYFSYPKAQEVNGAMGKTTLRLNAFSPYLSIAQLGGGLPMTFITSVNPIDKGLTRLRFSVGLPKKIYGDPPAAPMVEKVLQGNRNGIQCDVVIWENMSFTSPRNHTSLDAAALAFEAFCHEFV
jgi:3-ketosteroid 9alpha-monooxygenase subunit A